MLQELHLLNKGQYIVVAKVVRVREEAYARLLNVSRSYGLTIPQAANLLILGRVGRESDVKWAEEALPRRGKVRLERRGFRCPQCKRDLELMTSSPGLYMLKCPKCYGRTQLLAGSAQEP